MIKKLFYFLSVVLLLSSCSESNEEKAKTLAADYLKTVITHYDSYEPLVTEIDSLFISPERYDNELEMALEFAEILNKAKKCTNKIQKAEREMYIYRPHISEYLKTEPSAMYKQAMAEKENQETQRKLLIDKATKIFKTLQEDIESSSTEEFQGWIIYQKFKALNIAGTATLMDEHYFICDKEFKDCVGYSQNEFDTGNRILDILYNDDDADGFLETMITKVSI